MNDEQLNQLINGLPKRIEPRHDLWPAIEARLDQPKRSLRRPLFGIAAAVLAGACALGVFLSFNGIEPQGPATVRAASTNSNLVIARNIQVVNQAIARVREALQNNPTNPALQNLLYEAYAERNRLTIQQTELQLTRSYTS
ncbi:MAG TPA: hypothetical protein VFK45_00270 [Gammaproteobacteria bacterium]|nr:hypothetical protein [Gammaproteobacteria bacterium]